MNVTRHNLSERPSAAARTLRLGRHVEHDARSHAFAAPRYAGPVKTTFWHRKGPAFDQGELGSCTANAMLGLLMTEPFYRQDREFLESDCIELYKSATRLDTVPGHYPPDDTGSSGLAAMKAAKKMGYISGYHHVFSFSGVLQSLQRAPGITGISWYEGMDSPQGDHALVEPTGDVRGGHEIMCSGVDVEHGILFFVNSWGPTWGDHGRFSMSFGSYKRLLAAKGDYTIAVP